MRYLVYHQWSILADSVAQIALPDGHDILWEAGIASAVCTEKAATPKNRPSRSCPAMAGAEAIRCLVPRASSQPHSFCLPVQAKGVQQSFLGKSCLARIDNRVILTDASMFCHCPLDSVVPMYVHVLVPFASFLTCTYYCRARFVISKLQSQYHNPPLPHRVST